MTRSSSSSKYLFIYSPVYPSLVCIYILILSPSSYSVNHTCYYGNVLSSSWPLCSQPAQWLMQHIHKHQCDMLAEMWESIAGCSSCRGLFVSLPTFTFSHTEDVLYDVTRCSFQLFGVQRVLQWKSCGWQVEGWKNWTDWSGSEEVWSRWGLRASGLTVDLQIINYVCVRSSFCHQQCCLTILDESTEKMSVLYQRL